MKTICLILALFLACASQAFSFETFNLSCENVSAVCIYEDYGEWLIDIHLDRGGAQDFVKHQSENDGNLVTLAAGDSTLINISAHRLFPDEPVYPFTVRFKGTSQGELQRYGRLICPGKLHENKNGEPCGAAKGIHLFETSKSEGTFSYPLACEHIDKMELQRIRSNIFEAHGLDYAYPLALHVFASGGRVLDKFVDSVMNHCCREKPCSHYKACIRIDGGGETVKSHAPLWDNHDGEFGSIFLFRTPEAAIKAARMLCPEKVPSVMICDDFTIVPIEGVISDDLE